MIRNVVASFGMCYIEHDLGRNVSHHVSYSLPEDSGHGRSGEL